MKQTMLFVLLLVVVMCVEALPQERNCSKEEAIEAEKSAAKLDGWDDVYRSFRRFGHCDDGAIAEGYSASIMHLLRFHWDQLQKLNELSSSDSKFFAFVIRHIDATADQRDLKNVLIDSETHCPKSAQTLCSTIGSAAKKALAELEPQGK
jgi:hypothetical protein